jgi:cobalt transporter subunit CbtA
MSLFRAIVFTSVLVGIVAGTAVSLVQFAGTSQLIARAEVFEKAGETDAVSPVATAKEAHEHTSTSARVHEEGAWEPADGLERSAFTLAANILTAIGYALVLCGLMALRGKPVTWRTGLLWGVAGFACVMLAPMLGLPPELPGTPAAPLGDRQFWWIATALCTAVGIGLLALQRTTWAAVLAVIIVAAPHVVGAPNAPEAGHALAPEALHYQFIAAAAITSLVFWALLGSLSGMIFRRLEA